MLLTKIKNIIYYLHNKTLSPKNKAKKIGVRFGKNCIFAKSLNFGTEPYLIHIGDNFYSSENVKLITHDGSVNVFRNLYNEYKNIDYLDKIIIGNNVFLGIDVVVLPGSTIGDNVIVGAKSLVKGTLKSNSVYAGIPVRFICTIDEYLNKNKKNFTNTKNLTQEEKRKFLLEHYNLKGNKI